MVIKAWEHRLRHHHPRPSLWPFFNVLADLYRIETKPRCTFADMGRDCPVIKEFSLW